MGSLLARLALRLVPRSWRDAVARDLEDEAQVHRRGTLWRAWQAVRAGVRLLPLFSLDPLATDLRYAIRSLVRARGFTVAAVFTVVLGIGVTLAVFTVVDRALFRPLPFTHIDRLVWVAPFDFESGTAYYSFNTRLFIEGRTNLPAVEDMASAGFTSSFALGDGSPGSDTVALTDVSYNLLDVVGAVPALGRGFQRDDVVAGRDVALISHESWQSRFGGAGNVLGMTVRSAKRAVTVIGVLPKGFIAPAMNRGGRFDGVVMFQDLLESWARRSAAAAPGVARLAPGASIETAQAQYDVLAARLEPELKAAGAARGPRVRFEPLRPALFWYQYRYLSLLAIAAGLVGLLASANLAGLLLARGRSREQQVALRAALGASRLRLLTVEAAQSVIICAAAASISVGVVALSTPGLRAIAPPTMGPFVLSGVDIRVVVVTSLVALASAIVAGAWPAWSATRVGLMAVLQRGAGTPAHARRRRAGGSLLAAEAAIAIVLVAGAAVAGRNLVRLLTTDLGFTPAGLHVLRIQPLRANPDTSDTAALARYRGMLGTLRRQPGIAFAGGIDSMPASGAAAMSGATWSVAGRMGLWHVTDGLLETIGARTIAGRSFTPAEVDAEQPVAMLTEAAARRFWPADLPIAVVGREIVPMPDARPGISQPVRRVIGVLADIRDSPNDEIEPRVFVPVQAHGLRFLELAVRMTDPAIAPDSEALRRQLADPFGVTSVTVGAAGSFATAELRQPRTQAFMFGSFAVVGLLLAALGLFAVASFDVALRRYELGVRGALGASAGAIRGLVIRDALRPVAIGAAAGVLLAYWLAQFIQSLMHQIDARDPWTLAAVVAVLLVTALAAAWLPAHRASRIDPAEVLRTQ